jgi:dinuclear metal center YbgI/SA1388 family protein
VSITVQKIADFLEEKIPSSLAMSFDNVGLLCGYPEQEVTRVLVALDATREVIQEAVAVGAQLIITHHPIIFSPVKRILSNEPGGRRIMDIIENRLSVISLHTNLDTIDGGVNTVLAEKLGLKDLVPMDIGRMGTLSHPMTLDGFLALAKTQLGVSGLRYQKGSGTVYRVAVCGGSGGDLLYEAAASGCDTLVTGEVRHHQWLDGKDLGINILEADHYCTETVVLPVLKELVEKTFPNLDVRITQLEKQPSQGF